METMDTLMIKVATLEKGQEKQELINNDIFVKLDTKVSGVVFWSLNLIFVTILLAALGYIASRVDANASAEAGHYVSEDTKISYIQGVLKSYDLKVNN